MKQEPKMESPLASIQFSVPANMLVLPAVLLVLPAVLLVGPLIDHCLEQSLIDLSLILVLGQTLDCNSPLLPLV